MPALPRRLLPLRVRLRIGAPRSIALLALAAGCGGGAEPVQPPPPAAPAVSVTLGAATLAVERGRQGTVPVTLARTNYPGAVTLTVENLPAGVTATVTPAVVSDGATQATVTVAAARTAAVGAAALVVRGTGTGSVAASAPLALTVALPTPTAMAVVGTGIVSARYTSELWVQGGLAYLSSWGQRNGVRGNAVTVWDVTAAAPRLLDSVVVANATTTGDVQVSDDGTLLVVAVESNPNGGLAVYSLANPRAPQLLVRTTGGELQYGVHTAEVARVNGTLYAFCSVDPANGVPARLVIVSLANPASPQVVWSQVMGAPYIHDVFVRDGYLFTAEWNDGLGIWDIGAQGGSPAAPRRLARATTVGGKVHNIWWYHDASGAKRYLFVGEEGPGSIGSSSVGDLHVVDIATLAAPREVARFTVPGAGVHNVSVNERTGVLYAAYYNGGVRALDVTGDLGSCTPAERTSDGRCDLGLMGREVARFTGTGAPVYVWGVHWSAAGLFASDMLNGLWRLAPP